MPERLLEYEREWFFAINGSHTWWLDGLMLAFTRVEAWFPLLLIPLYFFFKRRKERMSMLICTLLTGVVSGLVTTVFFKPLFKRFRPTHHPSFMDDVKTVNDYIASGDYGFISGHTTNAFAFAVMSALVIKNKWYSSAIFIWAVMMAYSRIYLGAHFITDVIPGMIAGSLIGWFLYRLYNFMQNRKDGKTIKIKD